MALQRTGTAVAELWIYDEFVQVTRLVGGNNAFIEQTLPHLARLLVPKCDALAACPLIVLGHPVDSNSLSAWLDEGKQIHDLTGMKHPPRHPGFRAANWAVTHCQARTSTPFDCQIDRAPHQK